MCDAPFIYAWYSACWEDASGFIIDEVSTEALAIASLATSLTEALAVATLAASLTECSIVVHFAASAAISVLSVVEKLFTLHGFNCNLLCC